MSATPILSIMRTAGSEKVPILYHLPDVEHETTIPEDDVPIVRLAAAAQGILVTTDNRLIERLTATSDLAERNRFRAMRPEEAMRFADQPWDT